VAQYCSTEKRAARAAYTPVVYQSRPSGGRCPQFVITGHGLNFSVTLFMWSHWAQRLGAEQLPACALLWCDEAVSRHSNISPQWGPHHGVRPCRACPMRESPVSALDNGGVLLRIVYVLSAAACVLLCFHTWLEVVVCTPLSTALNCFLIGLLYESALGLPWGRRHPRGAGMCTDMDFNHCCRCAPLQQACLHLRLPVGIVCATGPYT